MQFDFNKLNVGGAFDRVLSTLPYPLDKEDLIDRAQGAGANPQIVSVMRNVLPEGTFKSAEDIKNIMRQKQTKM